MQANNTKGAETTNHALFTPLQALNAILARIEGEFDNAQLGKLGPLTDTINDIKRICENT
jgi:hypothetical protein